MQILQKYHKKTPSNYYFFLKKIPLTVLSTFMVKEKSHLHSRTNPSYQDEPIMIGMCLALFYPFSNEFLSSLSQDPRLNTYVKRT